MEPQTSNIVDVSRRGLLEDRPCHYIENGREAAQEECRQRNHPPEPDKVQVKVLRESGANSADYLFIT